MKTLFTIALAGFVSMSSLANENNEDLMALSGAKANYKTVNVLLKEDVGEARIAIYDMNGKRLHQRKVKDADRDQVIPYNLEDLPCGEYQVEITTDEESVSYTVNTFNRPIPVEELPLKANGKKLDNNKVNLSVFGLVEPGVEVEIRYEENDRVLHAETIETPKAFSKNYSFDGVEAEDIYFHLTDALGRTRVIHL
ncbi:hypothetical protein [Algoriphagus sediminis]|uniref:Por secretion system C-terminal sorting domain-containing protein n=1 Tax=Algoriphagus sediminis TaxID=3057113 RepID=A0ABT7YDN3_9BACT|nr:hypothetical protein [Algoriphagus sediminis]MDN3204598.1 hypothetical protein [Algoriphagus sediminis]